MPRRLRLVLPALALSVAPVAGAPAGKASAGWWAFRVPVRAPLPRVKQPGWARNPVDTFILQGLEAASLRPAPEADRRTLIRRLSFDLIGLPPEPERVDKFAADSDPAAYEKLVDELLASPHYGERWARHWLDVARYADSGGYETDIYYKNAWRYRDYVVRAFNADRPYHVFVQEQVAGDEIWPAPLELEGSYVVPERKARALEARLGTGLYALGPQIHESNMDSRRLTYERLTDWVDTTASAFLGLTLGCARCHDHKSDPLTRRDYYAMQALFAPSREVETPVAHAMAAASQKQHYPRLLAIDEARRAFRLFEQRTAGRPRTAPEEEERRRLLEQIATRVLELPEGIPDAPGGPWDGLMELPSASVLGHHEPRLIPEVRVLDRGELTRPRELARPDLPAVLRAATGTTLRFTDPQSYRRGLAYWLTRPEHPLTGRVLVNRVWQWHFGEGLVETPNDYGRMGRRPSHPELLDWLACWFTARAGPGANGGAGWSVKALHRLLVTSSTYRMRSDRPDPAAVAADPRNRRLWRMNRRRLEAEAVWDAVHAVAGTLNRKLGGRPVVPPLAEEEITALRDRWQWTVTADPAEHTRRGLYLLVRRNFRFPLFEAFDTPVNSVSCPRREVTTVAPQALWFMNNGTVRRQAAHFAARVTAAASPGSDAWIDRAWRLALGRPATPEETGDARRLLQELEADPGPSATDLPAPLAALPPARAASHLQLALTLLNLNEFLYVD